METTVKRRGRPPKNAKVFMKPKSPVKSRESQSTRKSGRSRKVGVNNSVTDGEYHRCKECKSTFPTKSSLALHMHKHNGLKPYSCKVCGNNFVREAGLLTHMVSCSTSQLTCTVCGKVFGHLANLRMHMNRHTGSKPYKCPASKCGAAFADAGTLRRHRITVHSENAPYQCKQCKAKFKRKDYLETHLRRIDHNNDRPNKSKLKVAAKQPKNVSPPKKRKKEWSCGECDLEFEQRSDLIKHVKREHASPKKSKKREVKLEPDVNDGSEEEDLMSDSGLSATRKEPYVCEQCNGEFDHRRDLRKHIKVIHGSEWLYICEICEIAFKHKGHLEKHNAIHSS